MFCRYEAWTMIHSVPLAYWKRVYTLLYGAILLLTYSVWNPIHISPIFWNVVHNVTLQHLKPHCFLNRCPFSISNIILYYINCIISMYRSKLLSFRQFGVRYIFRECAIHLLLTWDLLMGASITSAIIATGLRWLASELCSHLWRNNQSRSSASQAARKATKCGNCFASCMSMWMCDAVRASLFLHSAFSRQMQFWNC